MTVGEAARQLQMPPPTLKYWLEGGDRNGTVYAPVLRSAPQGNAHLTWGEFVEARYLRSYRSKTSMQRLRVFITELREQFQVPYPLAHFKPFVDENRDLLFKVQEKSDVPDQLLLVLRGRHGQYVLNPLIADRFVSLIDFSETEDQSAERLWPLGKKGLVVQDPFLSSGAATVRGVRTAVLRERSETGAGVEELAGEFSLTENDVRAALRHEWAADAA